MPLKNEIIINCSYNTVNNNYIIDIKLHFTNLELLSFKNNNKQFDKNRKVNFLLLFSDCYKYYIIRYLLPN